MFLYHYRSINSALLEIGDGTFHFASCEELNDPIEGYVRVFWQGDKSAWEGLFRNYVCSLSEAITLYLLRADEDMLRHKTLLLDVKQFDNVPLGNILKEIGDKFLADVEIQKMASFYGRNMLKVREEELELILRFIHTRALAICIQECKEHHTMPAEMVDELLDSINTKKDIPYPLAHMEEELPDEVHREAMCKIAQNAIEDLREFHYINLAADDETFLYGSRERGQRKTAKSNKENGDNEAITKARQQRNWMSVAVDFPQIYVDQLKDMIYPESYVVCFSGKNNDSSMWGNYADNHKGVCLIYETDNNKMEIGRKEQSFSLIAKPVIYDGQSIERNFFESFGRLTFFQIKSWLTGIDGISSAYDVFSDEDKWREKYWEVYDIKTYQKLKAWEHENEYRLAISNMFYEYSEPSSRNLRYDMKMLKGIIFGICTSESDKKRIMEKLREHSDELSDFTFYQAEFDDAAQCMTMHKKGFWKLG